MQVGINPGVFVYNLLLMGADIGDVLFNYLNFFKFGCPPHGGAGIGPGRLVMKILDIPSVKEVTFLPRDVRRLKP